MLIQMANVTKRFGALVVVDNLSFQLEPGEALGVLGPNGAGKTTVFNLLAGALAPDAGRIYLDGADVTETPPFERCRRGLARTHQIPHPFEGMSVFENLLVGGAFCGKVASEHHAYEACEAVLATTGLLPKANAPAGSLTLLERKRLELARALATRPRVLLLDEIAGGLTDAECRELVETIRAINAEGVAVVWIEHVVHALLKTVRRLMVINFGRLLTEGEPKAVMTDPRVREVYMGIPAA
jgi:branched-chain amino acid transport system ATP-binding protein